MTMPFRAHWHTWWALGLLAVLVAGPALTMAHEWWSQLPPAASHARIEQVALSPDRRHVRVTAIGSVGYSPDNPCSTDYRLWARIDDDVLLLAVLEVGRPFSFELSDVACPAIAGIHSLEASLPRPFGGTVVHSVGGATYHIASDEGATLTRLPDGWILLAGSGRFP